MQIRVNGEYVLAPELGELLTANCLLDISHDLRRDSRVNPCETMNVSTATALELIPEPCIGDAKLWLKHVVEERPEPLVEVPGGNVRITPEVTPAKLVPIDS